MPDLKKYLLDRYSYVIAESDRDFKDSQELVQYIVSYYEDIIAYMPGNVYWLDKNGFTVGCNQNVLNMFGMTKIDQFRGLTFEEMGRIGNWSHEATVSFKRDTLEVIKTKRPKFNIEEPPLPHSDGRIICFLTSRVPLLDNRNRIQGVVGISIDITQRKKLEEDLRQAKIKAEAANLAKTLFIGNMSHDIRTPLAGVIGLGEILGKEGTTQKDREYGQLIHTTSENLLSLLNDILAIVSAEELKEDSLNYEVFSLRDRIKHIEELFLTNLQVKNIQFKVQVDPNLPESIISDRIKIDRILLNLISNALKFTDHGFIELDVDVLLKNRETILQLTLTDSGIGIPEDKIDQIFDRFYRIAPSYEGKYAGHGIGLFIVKKFITLMGGSINVESKLGRGSKFTIILPVKEAKNEPLTHKSPILQETVIPLLPKKEPLKASIKDQQETSEVITNRILFIEDDEIARRTGQYFLESAGFNVLPLASAEEGIKAMKVSDFNLIVSDIGLPGIDGLELAILARNWEKKTGKKPVPIIGLSAHVTNEVEQEALAAGINMVLEKPINKEKIQNILALKNFY